MKAIFKLFAVVVLVACSSFSVAETRLDLTGTIAKQISGSGTEIQRRYVEDLLMFLVQASHQPQNLTLENFTALAGTDYETPFCVTRPDGIRRCMYTFTAMDFVARLNHLDTFTLKKESDSGSRVSMELNPDIVCLQHSTISKLWDVQQVSKPMPFQDFFAGSEDVDETQVTHEQYNNIVPTKPYIFVSTTSIHGCVAYLHLSAIPPTTL